MVELPDYSKVQAALTGRYTIERELGRGGMATVYLARDEKHDRYVALKVLRPELAATLGPDRFLREIQIAARLAHPHLLALHDSGAVGGFLYYVMPYVEGESLRQRLLRRRRLPLDEALQIAREAADALGYAHSHEGIVHRDVKPENILLSGGHAVVADFGIAVAITAAVAERLTGGGFIVGTPGYMSPEQRAGDTLDGRSDVYSLGCVLYEMLTGEPPFSGADTEAVLERRSLDPVARLRAARGTVPQAVERVIGRALEKSPADRFATAGEFAAALAAVAHGSHGWQVILTSRRVGVGLLATAVAVTGLVLVLQWSARSGGREVQGAALEADVSAATTSPAAREQLRLGQTRLWAGDFDGAAAAYHRAIAADSDLALAYHRLSVVQTWQWDYPAARRTIEIGLARRDRFSPRWRQLLEAQRHYVMRSADSAIAGFQRIAVDFPRSPDAWYGLGEALFHFGSFAGASPLDARPAFEHLETLNPTFAPVYYHLVELALLEHDVAHARVFLARMRPDDEYRTAATAAIALSSGDARVRLETLASLKDADRLTLKLLVAHFGHGVLDLPLAEMLAGYLDRPDRTPDDRVTGAQYRFVLLAAQGRWAESVAVWDSAASGARFDRWMALAWLAGFPAKARVDRMFAWASGEFAAGRMPDFRRPVWEEPEQAFHALVHRAVLQGDSASVRGLLRRIAQVAPAADPSDPSPPALVAALEARLALLARDTSRAERSLELSASRSCEPFGMFYPLTAMAPERWLLVQLAVARRDRATATRWLDSFGNTWSLGDVFYARRVLCMRDRLARGNVAVCSD